MKNNQNYIFILYESAEIKINLKNDKEDIRKKVYEILNIHPYFQNYENNVSDAYYDLFYENGSKIRLVEGISITFEEEDNCTFDLWVNQKDTISDIKRKIKKKVGSEVSKLIYKDIILNPTFFSEEKKLSQYLIDNNPFPWKNEVMIYKEKVMKTPIKVELSEKKMKINILMNENKAEIFYVNPFGSFSDLFDLMNERFKNSISLSDSFLYKNNNYDNYYYRYDNGLIEKYYYDDGGPYCYKSGHFLKNGIYDNINLRLISEPGFHIIIRVPKFYTIIISCESSETIYNIKRKIEDKTGFNADEQRLVFEGKLLENKKTIKDYNIKNLDFLHLSLPLK